jgi:hypothetical protein
LWSLLCGWRSAAPKLPRAPRRSPPRDRPAATARLCRFETMEQRRLMDADPIKIGVTYTEEDTGSDLHGDTFQVLFEGGAPNTELTRLVIDGDQGAAGMSVGDMIFDTIKGGLGDRQQHRHPARELAGGRRRLAARVRIPRLSGRREAGVLDRRR